MAPKRRGRKRGNKINPLQTYKNKRLQGVIAEFDCKVETTIKEMQVDCEDRVQQIRAFFDSALNNIPTEFHNLTLEEFLAKDKKTPPRVQTHNPVLTQYLNKFKSTTEFTSLTASRHKSAKKSLSLRSRLHKRNTGALSSTVSRGTIGSSRPKFIRKRIFSAHHQATPLTHKRAVAAATMATPLFHSRMTNAGRTIMNNSTLQSKPTMNSSTLQGKTAIITPKFDPRVPLPNMLLRRPKQGEVIMSLDGSPLQNCIAPVAEKPGLLLSLGGGKVVNIMEPSQLSSINLQAIDSQTKKNLKLVQQQLAGLLH